VAARGLPIRFRAVIDWAADCLETWKLNHAADHPDCELLKLDLCEPSSVETVVARGPADLILGGIPCEPISHLRTSGGPSALPGDEEMDRWYRLLDHCLGITRRLAPRWWSIEDIVSIQRHIHPLIAGFPVPMRRIDASAFGPQKRIRAFLGEFPDPKPEPGPRCLADCLLPGPHLTIADQERYERRYMRNGQLSIGNDRVRICSPDHPCPTVVGGLSRGSRQRRSWMLELQNGQLRILDWRELALVQGFPPDYVFAAGHMRTEKMIGQAIAIQVGRAILKAICQQRRRRLNGCGCWSSGSALNSQMRPRSIHASF
jgi:hypothetical protein